MSGISNDEDIIFHWGPIVLALCLHSLEFDGYGNFS